MYDLRSEIETVVNAWIAADSPEYIDLCVVFKSTEDALDNLETVVTQNAAVLIGDWITEPERWVYGHNKVHNFVDIIIAARDHDAQNALDELIRSVSFNCIDKQKYGKEETFDSFVEVTDEIVMEGSVKYQILTVKVTASETSPAPQIDIYPAFPIWIDPAEGRTFQVNNPYSAFSVRVKYEPHNREVDYILFILRAWPSFLPNEYSYVYKHTTPLDGETSKSFTLFHSDTSAGDYILYAILMNHSGIGAIATRHITITKGL